MLVSGYDAENDHPYRVAETIIRLVRKTAA
jgi:hypothetical protein